MNTTPQTEVSQSADTPRGNITGFMRYFRDDIVSGFLVFLIALPLCLAISQASGFPPIAGVFTAIIGSLLSTFISNSEMTIKGPAAGLIVIAIGCINDFGGNGMKDGWTDADMTAYQAALAVGFAAAVLQIVFSLFRGGILGEFFPSTVVHGMLAAIGIIIIAKQIPVVLGVSAAGEPLEMLLHIPKYIYEANPAIAAIGLVSLVIMFIWPVIGKTNPLLKRFPAPMAVLLIAVPMAMGFDLLNEHAYQFGGNQYELGDRYLVKMPDQVFGMFQEITLPNFQALSQFKAWKWVFMFFIIGSLESLLSAKAVDLLDPYKRKSDMDKDMLGVGISNVCASAVGGLPLISEIVRSKANIDNGAKTRFSNMWHGLFLLACVALIPMLLHRIPLAALAAMLVYTGYRLAHPTEFLNIYRIGKEQLAIFVTTMVVVLATDLLIGVIAGILLKMVIHMANGVPMRSLFKPYLEVQEVDSHTTMIIAKESAVFSNWLPFKNQIQQVGLLQRRNMIIDFSGVKFVDHSVLEKLEEVASEFQLEGLDFELRGMETLQPFADHSIATHKRGFTTMHRMTLIVGDESAEACYQLLAPLNPTFITSSRERSPVGQESNEHRLPVRIEVIISADKLDDFVILYNREIATHPQVTGYLDTVKMLGSHPKNS